MYNINLASSFPVNSQISAAPLQPSFVQPVYIIALPVFLDAATISTDPRRPPGLNLNGLPTRSLLSASGVFAQAAAANVLASNEQSKQVETVEKIEAENACRKCIQLSAVNALPLANAATASSSRALLQNTPLESFLFAQSNQVKKKRKSLDSNQQQDASFSSSSGHQTQALVLLSASATHNVPFTLSGEVASPSLSSEQYQYANLIFRDKSTEETITTLVFGSFGKSKTSGEFFVLSGHDYLIIQPKLDVVNSCEILFDRLVVKLNHILIEPKIQSVGRIITFCLPYANAVARLVFKIGEKCWESTIFSAYCKSSRARSNNSKAAFFPLEDAEAKKQLVELKLNQIDQNNLNMVIKYIRDLDIKKESSRSCHAKRRKENSNTNSDQKDSNMAQALPQSAAALPANTTPVVATEQRNASSDQRM